MKRLGRSLGIRGNSIFLEGHLRNATTPPKGCQPASVIDYEEDSSTPGTDGGTVEYLRQKMPLSNENGG